MYTIEERGSDSPYIERVWRSETEDEGIFTSVASNHWSMVIWEEDDQAQLGVFGPETRATLAPVVRDSVSFGVEFRIGTFMPHLPVQKLVDDRIVLPPAVGKSVWLNSVAWEIPTYDNFDVFVDRLVREDILVREPIVETSLYDFAGDVSLRTLQRRFLQATGISQNTIFQIERARRATLLLKSGVSILDTMVELGYYDQPHLTRSLKRFIGQTPAQILDPDRIKPLSYLYKTPDLL